MTVSAPETNPPPFPCSPSPHFHTNTPPFVPTLALTPKHDTLFLFVLFYLPACLPCVKKWRPSPVERRRLSFLHALRDSLLEKLRRSRSFGDLASLRPRPKSSLEVYVSVLCPPPPTPSPTLPTPLHLTLVCKPPFLGRDRSGVRRRAQIELQNATCVCMLPLHDVHKLACVCFSSRPEDAVVLSRLNRPEFTLFLFCFFLSVL